MHQRPATRTPRQYFALNDDDDFVIALVDPDSPVVQVRQLSAQIQNMQQQVEANEQRLLPAQRDLAEITEALANLKIDPTVRSAKQWRQRPTWAALLRDLGSLLFRPLAALIGYESIDYGRCPCCGASPSKEEP